MNTNSKKQNYNSPTIERICIDNEIALILVSGDPGDPQNIGSNNLKDYQAAPEYFNQHPVMDTMS